MNSIAAKLEKLVPGGYMPGSAPMTEPTAWGALALHTAGRQQAAAQAAAWLCDAQHYNGMVPATADGDAPGWTTSLATLAWREINAELYSEQLDRGIHWLLESKGKPNPQSEHVGHDTTLVGWSWAANTHSWLEPTAFATMALVAAGENQHPRTREAVRLMVDRLLPGGGANYGNTRILDQTLLPHLQPSSIVMWALAAQGSDDPRVERTLEYIEHELHRPTGCASMAYAIIALTAWNRRPADADKRILDAYNRLGTQDNCYKLSLLLLASNEQPLFAAQSLAARATSAGIA
ncbi:hypothetical protein [Aeoliella mucimassa]|uniref:Prenyltransferase and squalene oxidase repeat protein n=1 Tax=Aeoliella mucimassa TaxID=2527972 RepID=A0A518AJM7_9BACT|nr:hypothetical protein [Aeoliella mucimassa]QDU54896.1 hypothetical protein Pan181_10810 [Aeoliella mucimassa]